MIYGSLASPCRIVSFASKFATSSLQHCALVPVMVKDMLVPVFEPGSSDEPVSSAGVLMASVQRFVLYDNGAEDDSSEPRKTLFIVEDPEELDLLQIVQPSTRFREYLFQWETELSDIEACLDIVRPTRVTFEGTLQELRVPTLCLVDALDERGFTFQEDRVIYHDGDDAIVDARRLHGRKDYLLCMLALSDLFSNGARPFHSRHTNAFYKLLARSPAAADPSMSAATIRAMLHDLPLEPSMPSLRRCAPAICSDLTLLPICVSGDSSGDVRDAALQVDGMPVLEDAPAASAAPCLAAPVREGAHHVAGDEIEPTWPLTIFGKRVSLESHKRGGRHNRGIRVECATHVAPGQICRCFRSVTLDTQILGPSAAALFLGCWHLLVKKLGDTYFKPCNRYAS